MPSAVPIVLLHGLSSTPRCWDRLSLELADRHRLIPIDLFPSGSALARFALSDAATGLTTFLEQDGGPSVLVGHSMGGLIALQIALEHPELVDRMVLVGVPAVPGIGSLVRRSGGVLRSTGRLQPGTIALLATGLWRTGPLRLYDALRDTLRADLASRLEEVRMPTLLVWGELDTIVPVEVGERMAALLPDAHLVVIPEAGHMPQWEKPAAFTAALLPFLAAPVPRHPA